MTYMNAQPIRTLDAIVAELLPRIDEILAERDEPLSRRPHSAAMMIVEHCIVDIHGDSKEGYLTKPWFGSILAATLDWYSMIYGKSLQAQGGSVHAAAILIRQTPFILNIPLSSCNAQAADSTFWIALLANVQPEENPLDWIADPPNLSKLSEEQLEEVIRGASKTANNIRQTWNAFLTADHGCERARRHSALVLPHLESSAWRIAKHDHLAFSSAIWDANFAAEQAIKCYLLQDRSIKIPKLHDVKKLHTFANWSNPPPQDLLDSIGLMPSGTEAVRYRYTEMGKHSLSAVIELYAASQSICSHYAQALPGKFKFENANFKMKAPPMPKRDDA